MSGIDEANTTGMTSASASELEEDLVLARKKKRKIVRLSERKAAPKTKTTAKVAGKTAGKAKAETKAKGAGTGKAVAKMVKAVKEVVPVGLGVGGEAWQSSATARRLDELQRGFDCYRGADEYEVYAELGEILDLCATEIRCPRVGVEFLAEFYARDEYILPWCANYNGTVAMAFTDLAAGRIEDYAAKCDSPGRVVEVLLALARNDRYGLRAPMIQQVAMRLPRESAREILDTLRQWVRAGSGNLEGFSNLALHLAQDMREAELYEELAGELAPHASSLLVERIPQVYLESGDADTALARLESMTTPDAHSGGKESLSIFEVLERNLLLADIYRKQGDQAKLAEVQWENFRLHIEDGFMDQLLETIGEERRPEVLDRAQEWIMEDGHYHFNRLDLLLTNGREEAAERYLLAHREELDLEGFWLEDLAMRTEGFAVPLIRTLIVRNQLTEFLEHGGAKSGRKVKHWMRELEDCARQISDWRGELDHAAFVAEFQTR